MNGERGREVRKVELSKSLDSYWIEEEVTDSSLNELPLGVRLTGANELSKAGLRGEGVKVAVVDTGVDDSYLLFNEKVTAQQWYRQDGDTTHGTHVAGIIHLIAPDAEIRDYCCFGKSGEYEMNEGIANAIVQAHLDGCRVICLSIGTPTTSIDILRAVSYVHGKGAIIVTAPGNAGGDGDVLTNEWSFPCVHEECLSVAALEESGTTLRASFNTSKKDPNVQLAGIGSRIKSYKSDTERGYTILSGTSMAAPQVCGFIAALLSEGSDYKTMLDQELALSNGRTALSFMEDVILSKFGINTGIKGYDNKTPLRFLSYLNETEFSAILRQNGIVLNDMPKSTTTMTTISEEKPRVKPPVRRRTTTTPPVRRTTMTTISEEKPRVKPPVRRRTTTTPPVRRTTTTDGDEFDHNTHYYA